MVVQDKTIAGIQGCDFICVNNCPEKVSVAFRAAVLSVMRQSQTQESFFGTHCVIIDKIVKLGIRQVRPD